MMDSYYFSGFHVNSVGCAIFKRLSKKPQRVFKFCIIKKKILKLKWINFI